MTKKSTEYGLPIFPTPAPIFVHIFASLLASVQTQASPEVLFTYRCPVADGLVVRVGSEVATVVSVRLAKSVVVDTVAHVKPPELPVCLDKNCPFDRALDIC